MNAENEPRYKISFTHSLSSVNSLATRLWLLGVQRYWGWVLIPGIFLLIAFSPSDLGSSLRQVQWALGFSAGIFSLSLINAAQSYKNYIVRWQKHIDKTYTFQFDTARIRYQSDVWSGEWPWQSVTMLWRWKYAWLFYQQPYGEEHLFIVLPVDALSQELKKYIVDKVANTGGRVI